MSEPPRMKVVLVTPEIPGNTGTIGRTCVALDLELILIKPYGFDISEKSCSEETRSDENLTKSSMTMTKSGIKTMIKNGQPADYHWHYSMVFPMNSFSSTRMRL